MITRIIPRLDIKGPNLVKGIHLEGLRVLGKPELFAQYYYENGADELIYQDVVASLYERNSLKEIIEKTARNIFIPLTVGGGIRTLEDIKNILRFGADKVSINTAALKRPEFISEAANKFGSSTIAVAIEAIKHSENLYFAFMDNGREFTGIEVYSWAKKIETLGAGEIIITSVDQEGTRKGFDIELISNIASIVNIPIIVHGGLGKYDDTLLLKNLNIGAICASSVFHYDIVSKNIFKAIDFEEGNYDFLMSKSFEKCENNFSINELKDFMSKNNFNIRCMD